MEPLDARPLAISTDPAGKHLVRLQFTNWVAIDAIVENRRERRLWQRFPVGDAWARLTWFEDRSETTVRGELFTIQEDTISAPG